jgi:hypothetical protein
LNDSIRVGVGAVIILLTALTGAVPALAADVSEAGAPEGAIAVVVPAVEAFEEVFAAFDACLGQPTILFENLPGRKGEYRVGLSTVALNPNRPVDGMAQVVVHELAHHLMIACGLDRDPAFRESFYLSQGLSLDRGWYDYSEGWSATPAEQFAEVATRYVLGMSGDRIRVESAALAVVAELAGPVTTTARWSPKASATEVVNREHSRTFNAALTALAVETQSMQILPMGRPSLGAAIGLSGWRTR